MTPPDDFAALSPLGKIPVLTDGPFSLPDSSVICAFLEAKYPAPPLYPEDPEAYARALWFEEYVDGALVQDITGIVFQKIIRPRILRQPTDSAVVDGILATSLPKKLSYLEENLGSSPYFVANELTLADVTVASSLVNFHYAGYRLDDSAHRRLNAHFRRMLKTAAFTQALEMEQSYARQLGLDQSFLG